MSSGQLPGMPAGHHSGSDAYELLDPHGRGPVFLTCEHATNRLPAGISASPGDRLLLDDHWGWDIGAREVTVALTSALGGPAVLARFSRLVVDPNRRPTDAGYIVREIDGQVVSFNDDVDAADRARRTQLHDAYHDAVDRSLGARIAAGPVTLLAVHSFTPIYLGRPRAMEVGVLFDEHDELAWRLESALAERGFECALNAPYSGKGADGLIYAAQRHGRAHGIPYLELEIRQDLIATPEDARAVAARIAPAVRAVLGAHPGK